MTIDEAFERVERLIQKLEEHDPDLWLKHSIESLKIILELALECLKWREENSND